MTKLTTQEQDAVGKLLDKAKSMPDGTVLYGLNSGDVVVSLRMKEEEFLFAAELLHSKFAVVIGNIHDVDENGRMQVIGVL